MSFEDSGAAWFLAQLKPNGQRIAERNLRRQGFRTYLPRHEETRRARGRFRTELRPLFPGYIFVMLDILGGKWRAVNSTYGVTCLVGQGGAPAAVPNGFVDDLARRYSEDGAVAAPANVQPGDRVTLLSGPFADFVATVERHAPDRRVWVLLDLLGRSTRLNLDRAQLRAS